ncbi:MAG TPA: hypothetical protein VLL52_11065 [Anaerolineae bacterium]|nr:hypothetical protein [Anaerolineae bacterium]
MGQDSLVAQTEMIIGLEEKPVVRNLLITQCYHELAEGVGEWGGELDDVR